MTLLFWIPIAFLVVSFLLRIPIAYGMLMGAVVYFFAAGQNIGSLVPLTVNAMMNSYVLLSVPLYIFTANVMNSGEVTEKIYNFVNALFCRVKGSSAYVNIFGSLIFAGMTGSSVADASGLGKMEITQMKKEGYDAGFSCALSATTAVLGPTFPPSIIMVIYSTLTNASVGKLFMGGVIPSLVLSLALGIYIYIMAQKHNFPLGVKQSARKFLITTIQALPALLTPVVLLGGIYTGIFTPTEAGAIGALYALIVAGLIYKSLSPQALWQILKETARTTGSVGLIVMASYAFSHIVAAEKAPEVIGNFLTSIGGSKNMFLLISMTTLLILGCFFDSNTIQLVFLPTIIPTAMALGVDMVHFGVITSMNIIIGQCTPPFGVLLFITSGISGTPLKDVIKNAVPMVIVEIIVLFLLTFIPDIVMFLPNMMSSL